uniref:C-type lectin domain-containing protein n=1 Tax=Knipowitschia caucasica TaxID=637954 RepID=A0AAV2LH00_KNICA
MVASRGDNKLLLAAGPSGWIGLHRDSQNSTLWKWSGVVETPMPWEKAMKHCKTNDFLGLTWDKLTLAAGEMDRKNVVQGWIGLRFLGDQWQWVSGRQLESETREKLQECPGQNRCAALYSDGLLQSTDCAQELPFICE